MKEIQGTMVKSFMVKITLAPKMYGSWSELRFLRSMKRKLAEYKILNIHLEHVINQLLLHPCNETFM